MNLGDLVYQLRGCFYENPNRIRLNVDLIRPSEPDGSAFHPSLGKIYGVWQGIHSVDDIVEEFWWEIQRHLKLHTENKSEFHYLIWDYPIRYQSVINPVTFEPFQRALVCRSRITK